MDVVCGSQLRPIRTISQRLAKNTLEMDERIRSQHMIALSGAKFTSLCSLLDKHRALFQKQFPLTC